MQQAPGIPCSLCFEGKEFQQTSGAVRRENANVYLNERGARNFVARMKPTGRANARPMTGSAKQSIHHTTDRHTPRMRGIQYAAASRFNH